MPAAPGQPVGCHAGAATLVGRLSPACSSGLAGTDPAAALAAAHALALRLDALLARHGLTKAGLALDLAGDLFVAVALPSTASAPPPSDAGRRESGPDSPSSLGGSSACAPPRTAGSDAPSTSGGAGAGGSGLRGRPGLPSSSLRGEGGDGATPTLPAAGEAGAAPLLAALRAATSVHASLGQVALPSGARAVLQLGVAAGDVVDGLIGCGNTLDYRIAGPALELARRLAAAAPPGGTLVSADAAAAVGGPGAPLPWGGALRPAAGLPGGPPPGCAALLSPAEAADAPPVKKGGAGSGDGRASPGDACHAAAGADPAGSAGALGPHAGGGPPTPGGASLRSLSHGSSSSSGRWVGGLLPTPLSVAASAASLAARARRVFSLPSFAETGAAVSALDHQASGSASAAALEAGFRGWWGRTRGRHDALVAGVALVVTAVRVRQALVAAAAAGGGHGGSTPAAAAATRPALPAALLAADAALMAVVAGCLAASGVGHRVRAPLAAGVRALRSAGILAAAAAAASSAVPAAPAAAAAAAATPAAPAAALAACRAGCAGPLLLASLAEANLGAWHLGADAAVVAAAVVARAAGAAGAGGVRWSAAVLAAQVLVGTLLPTALLFTWERGMRADYADAVAAARARGRCRG